MIHPKILSLLAILSLAVVTHAADTKNVTTNFHSGPSGWSAGFADYPVGSEAFYELASGLRKLPSGITPSWKAFYISGNNHSDDLCMFLRRHVTGLLPNTRYRVRFSVSFASNAPLGAIGVGGSPGESVYVKAGLSRVRPVTSGVRSQLNIDKGDQAVGGRNAKVIGNVGVNLPDGSTQYLLKTLTTATSYTTDAHGAVWLFVASDSGFEGTTSLYYSRISVVFSRP